MKSILLIGLGRFGTHLAAQLNRRGHQVMGIDKNEERVNETMRYLTDAQIGDSTNEDLLSALEVSSFDVCFVTIGKNFQSSLETTCMLWLGLTNDSNIFCCNSTIIIYIGKLIHTRECGLSFWSLVSLGATS